MKHPIETTIKNWLFGVPGLTFGLLTMLPGVNTVMISVEAMAPYLAFVAFFTSIPFSVRHAVVRRPQNLCTQFIYILHARVRSWELVQHFCGEATQKWVVLAATVIKGSLEVKLPTIWGVEQQSREVESEDEKQRREVESEERRYNCAKVRRKKIRTREMLGKSRNAVFFPMICGSAGSKNRLAKAAGAEPCVQGRHEKLHAALPRSTFSCINAQKLTVSDVEKYWTPL